MKIVKMLLLAIVILAITPEDGNAQWYKKLEKEVKRAGRKIDKNRKKLGHKIDRERKRLGHKIDDGRKSAGYKIDRERRRSGRMFFGKTLELTLNQQGRIYREGTPDKIIFENDEILVQDQDGNYYYTSVQREHGEITGYSSYYYSSDRASWQHVVDHGSNLRNEVIESHEGKVNSGGRVVPKNERNKFLEGNRPE